MIRSVLKPFKAYTKSILNKTLTTNFSSQNDVVIIGGGVIGCSILYQLAKRGISATLIERGKLTCGTTFHAAGLVWSLRPNQLEIEILKRTKQVFKELGEDECGWINNGSLFIAHSTSELDQLIKLSELGKSLGVNSCILGRNESVELFPLLDSEKFEGALYSPEDGVMDPYLLCNALAKSSKRSNSTIIENCNVTEILYDQCGKKGKKVRGVSTDQGDFFKADIIVNARGLWSNQNLNIFSGTPLPFKTMKHTYVVTDTIPNINKWPNVRDHDLSIYFRVQGQSLIIGGYESNPTIVNDVPNDFQFSLYEMDWITFEPLMENSVQLCPFLENVGIKSTVCGPEAFSFDRKPLIGPDDTITGLFHACAFSSNGMMLCGGVAEQIAEWIVNGKPSLDMGLYDLRRYNRQQAMDEAWIRKKCMENFLKPIASICKTR